MNTLFKLPVQSGASGVSIKTDKLGHLRLDGRLLSVKMRLITFQEARFFIEHNIPKVFCNRWK